MNRGEYHHSVSDEEVNQLLSTLKTYQPTIPDEVTKYLLQTAGCDIEDDISIRLVSLATQRYITEVISKANEYNKERQNREHLNGNRYDPKREALLVEDLQNALHEMGTNVQKKNMYSY